MSRKPHHRARLGAPVLDAPAVAAPVLDAPVLDAPVLDAPVAGVDDAGEAGVRLQRIEDAGPIDVGVEAGPVVDTAGPEGLFPDEFAIGAATPGAPDDVAPALTLPPIGILGAGPTPIDAGPPRILPLEIPQLPPDALPNKDPALEGDVTRAEGAFGGVPPVYAAPVDGPAPYVAPVDRVPAPGAVRITCTRPGHVRAGVAHPAAAVYAPGTFTPAQLGAFDADPYLAVVPLAGAAVARAHRLP